MTHFTLDPNRQALAAMLPGNTYHYLIHTLCSALPNPHTDSPEDLARRNDNAIAEVAGLCPANLAEAKVAALHVACSEHALACFRQAEHPDTSFQDAGKCRAQADSMTRQSYSGLRLLQRMQAARQKIEANQETRDRAAWAEHCARNLMTEALQPPSPCGRGLGEGAAPQADTPELQASPCGTGLGEGAAPTADTPELQASPCERGLGEGAEPESHHTQPDTAVSPKRAAMARLFRRLDDPDDELVQTPIDIDLATPGGLRFSPDSGTNGASASGSHTAPQR